MPLQLLSGARSHVTRALWAVADQGANPLVQLALTPYLLGKLGKADFGIWALANTFLNLSQLVSCGAGIAATKHVSADLAVGATEDAIAATRSALTIAVLGGAAAAILAWILAPTIATAFFAHMGGSQHVAPIVALSGIAAAIQEVDNIYAAAMRGAERFDLCAKIEVPSRIAMGGGIVFLGWQTPNVHTLFLGLIAMMGVKALLKANQVRGLFQTKACFCPSVSIQSIRRVLRFGVWQWLQSAGTALFSATDQLIIGSLLGAAALTRYSVCLQIAQYVHVIPSVMTQVIFPRVSALGPQLDARRGNQILWSATVFSVGTALLLGLPIMALAYPVLRFWIGADFAADNYWLLIVLVSVHIVLAANIGAYFVLLGSDRAAKSAAIVLSAGVVQSGFAIVVAPFGILAVACNRFLYALLTIFLYRAARFKPRD
jgi:O-antigen/teichoic acid export membrane protein